MIYSEKEDDIEDKWEESEDDANERNWGGPLSWSDVDISVRRSNREFHAAKSHVACRPIFATFQRCNRRISHIHLFFWPPTSLFKILYASSTRGSSLHSIFRLIFSAIQTFFPQIFLLHEHLHYVHFFFYISTLTILLRIPFISTVSNNIFFNIYLSIRHRRIIFVNIFIYQSTIVLKIET